MEGSVCFPNHTASSWPLFQLNDNIFVTAQSLKDKDERQVKGLRIVVLKGRCSRPNDGLQRFQVLIPRTSECYLLWQKKKKNIADEIKLRILRD